MSQSTESIPDTDLNRRDYLKLAGGATATTGLATHLLSTATATTPPEIQETTLTITNRTQSDIPDSETASIGFDENTVMVTGTAILSTPCHELTLDPQMETDGNTLYVNLSTTKPSDGGCTQVLTAASYRATITLSGSPAKIIVKHDNEQIATKDVAEPTQPTTTPTGLTIQNTTLELTDSRQSNLPDTGTATVTIDGTTVVVTGTIILPNPCHDVHLDAQTTQETLTVNLVSTPPTTGGCVAVLSAVDYRATIELTAAPTTITVNHDDTQITTHTPPTETSTTTTDTSGDNTHTLSLVKRHHDLYANASVDYTLTVSDTITKTETGGTLEGSDTITQTTVSGTLTNGDVDSYTYTGEITDFQLDGNAAVYIDGQPVSPTSLDTPGTPTVTTTTTPHTTPEPTNTPTPTVTDTPTPTTTTPTTTTPPTTPTPTTSHPTTTAHTTPPSQPESDSIMQNIIAGVLRIIIGVIKAVVPGV